MGSLAVATGPGERGPLQGASGCGHTDHLAWELGRGLQARGHCLNAATSRGADFRAARPSRVRKEASSVPSGLEGALQTGAPGDDESVLAAPRECQPLALQCPRGPRPLTQEGLSACTRHVWVSRTETALPPGPHGPPRPPTFPGPAVAPQTNTEGEKQEQPGGVCVARRAHTRPRAGQTRRGQQEPGVRPVRHSPHTRDRPREVGEPREPALETPSTPAPRPPGPPAASEDQAGWGWCGTGSPPGPWGHGQGGRSFD